MTVGGENLQEEMWPERFASILDRVTDAFFALDEHWRFTYLNAQAAQLLFRDCDDLLGKSIWNEFTYAVDTEFYTECFRAMAEQVAVTFEEFYSPLNVWFEVRVFPSASGLTVYFRDVTLKHQNQEKNQQHFQSLFHQNPDAVFSLSQEGCFLHVNPDVERLTGIAARELLGTLYYNLILEPDMESAKQQFQQAVMGRSQTYEISIEHKDGRILRLQVTNLPIFVDGQVVGVYGIAKDITELQQTIQRLRESENRLTHAQRIAQLGYWDWNLVTNRVEQSEELRRIYGVERNSMNSYESFFRVVHPEDRQFLQERLRASFSGGAFDMEFRILRPDGSERIIYSQAEVQYKDGTPVRMHGINIDVTERRRTEGARRAAEKRFLALVQAAHDAIVVMDASGEVKLWNHGAESTFGFTAEEMLGSTIHELALPNYRSHHIRGIVRLLKQRRYLFGNTIELPLVRKDGRTISIEFSLTELIDQNEIHFIAIMRDVTERKKMQTRLMETQQRYRSFIAHNPNGVCAVDRSKKLMECNSAIQEMLGYTGAELLNMHYCDLVLPEQRKNLADILQDVLRGRVKTHEELTFRHKNGHLIDVGITHIPIWVQNQVVGSCN